MNYKFKPISLKSANNFVSQYHRHNKPVAGHKFSIGLTDDTGQLIGVGICGRPVARMLDDSKTLEISRVCVIPEHKNANSMIYGRLVKIARLFGFEKIITYSLTTESAATMKAIGAVKENTVKPREWSCPSRQRKSQDIYKSEKIRWSL
jgi:hypothetical protein